MSEAKILIVEDEGIEALDIQHRLISLGYPAPEIAFSGEEAVQKAEKIHPDLVLMDIMLQGGIDGITAAGQIQASFDVPVIYLTAYADADTLQRAKITEPYGYILKPFKERELHITIDMALYKHKMERKLKESEKWLATTLKSIGDAVIATDREGLVTFMNVIAENLTGWKLNEILHHRLTEVFNVVNKDTRQPVENPVTRVMRDGTIVGLANHTLLIARDGAEILIDDSAAPITDDKGNTIGVILVFRDVTEREKAMEEICRYRNELEIRVQERTAELERANQELRANAAKLEQANKELQEFAFVASHDLKEPLRKITTFGELLKTGYGNALGEEGQDYLDRMTRSAERMNNLIGALLDYSRVGRSQKPAQLTDLTEVAKDAASDLSLVIEQAGACLEIGQLPMIEVNPNQMRQLFQNLIGNALKYGQKHEKPVIKITGYTEDTLCHIFVEDNGMGFEERYLDRIFRPFQRLQGRSQSEGMGMGLAICRKITERHGGTITARSTPGEGSTFIVTLPLKQSEEDKNTKSV
ncbi:MAG: ATP-binding protein [bacterium]